MELLCKLNLTCTYPPQHCPIPGPSGIFITLFAILLSINFLASSITKYSKFPPPIVPKIVSVEINIISSKLLGDDPLTSIILALTILLLKFIFLLNFLRYILMQTF